MKTLTSFELDAVSAGFIDTPYPTPPNPPSLDMSWYTAPLTDDTVPANPWPNTIP